MTVKRLIELLSEQDPGEQVGLQVVNNPASYKPPTAVLYVGQSWDFAQIAEAAGNGGGVSYTNPMMRLVVIQRGVSYKSVS